MTKPSEPNDPRPDLLRLRPTETSDESFLTEVFASTRMGELGALNRDQRAPFVSMQFRLQSENYRLSFPQAEHSVIMIGDTRIGRMIVDRSDQAIRLVDIAILPEYRNRGIGTYLLQKLAREAGATYRPVTLHVYGSNPALRLYQRLGFTTVGEEGPYLVMTLSSNTSSSRQTGRR